MPPPPPPKIVKLLRTDPVRGISRAKTVPVTQYVAYSSDGNCAFESSDEEAPTPPRRASKDRRQSAGQTINEPLARAAAGFGTPRVGLQELLRQQSIERLKTRVYVNPSGAPVINGAKSQPYPPGDEYKYPLRDLPKPGEPRPRRLSNLTAAAKLHREQTSWVPDSSPRTRAFQPPIAPGPPRGALPIPERRNTFLSNGQPSDELRRREQKRQDTFVWKGPLAVPAHSRRASSPLLLPDVVANGGQRSRSPQTHANRRPAVKVPKGWPELSKGSTF